MLLCSLNYAVVEVKLLQVMGNTENRQWSFRIFKEPHAQQDRVTYTQHTVSHTQTVSFLKIGDKQRQLTQLIQNFCHSIH